MALHVAVDIGGTFTDLIGYDDETGELFSAKSPTTPRDLTLGILECIKKSGIKISNIKTFVHGSTTAINTVIERKGAKTALVVTKGTKDVYQIGRGNRPEAYNIFFKRPTPLVPRYLTFEIEERILSTGEVLVPFNIEQAQSVANQIAQNGIESIAVCFLHSWANPSHEKKMGELLAFMLPNTYLSLSHNILREYGEYERISTTVLNSYIGPKIEAYIDGLEKMLLDHNFRGNLLIMQSNGGIMSPKTAKQIPVSMLESGPVGGFIAAAHIGSSLGFRNVIAFDMGGTTAKTNLIKDGQPQIAHGYYIGGYASGHPMMLPVVDVVEIGAGGGSIAWVDDVGALKVGPQSAGADPGPICYGWGGKEPTITDANLLCGRLSKDAFLGGEMILDPESAKEGIIFYICRRIGLSPIEIALAITKIAVINMSLAVRGISVERGYDPRDFALICFGGAGSLHAVEIARELHIPTVIIPNYPSHFCALGMLMADIKHDYVRTYYKPFEKIDFNELKSICEELINVGLKTLENEGVSKESIIFQRFLDIRYKGQEFTISVPINVDEIEHTKIKEIRKSFEEIHDRRYGYFATDQSLEVVNVRLTAIGKRKPVKFQPIKIIKSENPLIGKRIVYFDHKKEEECAVYLRDKLVPGYKIKGPAIIQEYASTTVLFPGDLAEVADTGEIIIHIGGD